MPKRKQKSTIQYIQRTPMDHLRFRDFAGLKVPSVLAGRE